MTREFRAQLPQAALSISEGLSNAMQEAIVNGRLDIALLYGATPMLGLDITPLLDEDLFLVQRQGQRQPPKSITLQKLAALPLIIPTRPNAIRMLVESEMAAIACEPQIALEIDGVPAILDLVLMARAARCCQKRGQHIGASAFVYSLSDCGFTQQNVHRHQFAAPCHVDTASHAEVDTRLGGVNLETLMNRYK